jgi:thiamine pyrophosphokinase
MDATPPGAPDTVVVVTGGDPVAASDLTPVLLDGAYVIAADSGVERAAELGLGVDLAVGDFDSVDPIALEAAASAGARVERHPPAKDATDLELALDAALAREPARILVVGGHGGRLDHFLANALLLAAHAYDGVQLVAQMGPARVTVVHRRADLHGSRGDLVTIVPVHGRARGVTTTGLLYPLRDDTLESGSTRGVSNELTSEHATVDLQHGVLLVVQPGQRGTHQQNGAP